MCSFMDLHSYVRKAEIKLSVLIAKDGTYDSSKTLSNTVKAVVIAKKNSSNQNRERICSFKIDLGVLLYALEFFFIGAVV